MQRRKGWWEDAACQGVGAHIFFPPIGRGVCLSKIRVLFAEAKTYCDTCPVKRDCLEAQLKVEKESWQFDGMWGGLLPYERKELLSQREWDNRRSPVR